MAKKKDAAAGPPKVGRLKQMTEAYRMTRSADPKLNLVLAGVFFADFALVLLLGILTGHPIFGSIFAVLTGVLSLLFVLGSRAQKAAYKQVEGQPGAAAAVLQTIRKGWTLTPAVAANKNQDVIHRAVGRPGIVLIAEGPPSRVGNLLLAERKRMLRFVADAPVHEVLVGDGEGQVPLRDLTKHLTKMDKTLKPPEVTAINDRLRALGDLMKYVPIPKGPMPRGGPKGKIR
jgi:hypothetical protein